MNCPLLHKQLKVNFANKLPKSEWGGRFRLVSAVVQPSSGPITLSPETWNSLGMLAGPWVQENIFAGEATEEADENAIPSSDSEDITPVGDYETAVDQQEGITESFEDAVQSQIQMTHEEIVDNVIQTGIFDTLETQDQNLAIKLLQGASLKNFPLYDNDFDLVQDFATELKAYIDNRNANGMALSPTDFLDYVSDHQGAINFDPDAYVKSELDVPGIGHVILDQVDGSTMAMDSNGNSVSISWDEFCQSNPTIIDPKLPSSTPPTEISNTITDNYGEELTYAAHSRQSADFVQRVNIYRFVDGEKLMANGNLDISEILPIANNYNFDSENNVEMGYGNSLNLNIAARGYVYVGSDDNKFYCLNASTGSFIWSYTTGDSVYSSPAIVGDCVYVGSTDNTFYCFTTVPSSLSTNTSNPSSNITNYSPNLFFPLIAIGIVVVLVSQKQKLLRQA